MKILLTVWMKNISKKTQKSEFKGQLDKIILRYWVHQSKDVRITQIIMVNSINKLDCAPNEDIN